MSYDLYFWRQKHGFQMNPKDVLDQLFEDSPIDGIVAFPRDEVRQKLKQFFPDIQDGDFELTWEGSGSYFQVSFGHATEKDVHLIIANCGFELLKAPDAINRLIDACTDLGCALFDPQTGERYQQPEPKG